MEIKIIKKAETYDWIINKHYAKRLPSISWAFGLFVDNALEGILTMQIKKPSKDR